MKKAALLLPPLFLLLSADRLDLSPPRFPPARLTAPTWASASMGLPGTNEGRGGAPGDPLNLVFLARADVLRKALRDAGWTELPLTVRGSIAAGFSELLEGKPLSSFPPMNEYRLLGRRQSMNWARPIRFPGRRHHFRLWNTGMTDLHGRSWWWGSGNLDAGVRWTDLSHRPDPDMDKERDYVLGTLSASPLLEAAVLTPLARVPTEGVNDKGYPYRTDGRVAVILLREPRPTRPSGPGAGASAPARGWEPNPLPPTPPPSRRSGS